MAVTEANPIERRISEALVAEPLPFEGEIDLRALAGADRRPADDHCCHTRMTQPERK